MRRQISWITFQCYNFSVAVVVFAVVVVVVAAVVVQPVC